MMTNPEKLLWAYIDEESDEMMLKAIEAVNIDGFGKLQPGESGTEMVAVKILSVAMIKTLQIICERSGGPDLVTAFMQLSPLHAEIVKMYVAKEMGLHGND